MSKIALLAAVFIGAAFCAAGCAGIAATDIFVASSNGNLPELDKQLARGYHPDTSSAFASHQSPLMVAAGKGHEEIVTRLISKGANVNLGDDNGVTALHFAAANGQVRSIEQLLDSGASINSQNRFGDTPLHMAVNNGKAGAMAKLISSRAELNAQNKMGLTPLHFAVFQDNPAFLNALLEAGAKVDVPDQSGQTPLFLAAWKGRMTQVQELLRANANPSVVNANGVSAIQAAQMGNQTAISEVLASVQADAARRVVESLRKPSTPSPASDNRSETLSLDDIPAPSPALPAKDSNYALVVGIEEYQSVPTVRFGQRDANSIQTHLEALGFPRRNIVMLSGSQATGNKLKSYLEEWLPMNASPDSTVFFYYSGHGAPDPKSGDAYLVPWDGDPKFLKSTAYPLKKLYADLQKTKANRIIVALDACFSGAGGRSVLAQGARPLVAKVDAGVPVSDRLTVLAAASGDEITGALEDRGHGMFTYFLLKGLSQGKRSAKSLHDYLSPKVKDEARRQNRSQSPVLSGPDASF